MQIQLCVLGLRVLPVLLFKLRLFLVEHLSLELESGYNMKTMILFFVIVFFAFIACPGKCRLPNSANWVLQFCIIVQYTWMRGLITRKNWFPFCHEKIETQKLGSADFVKKIKFSPVFVEQRVSRDKFKQPRGANTSVLYLDKGSWRSALVAAKSLERESKIIYGHETSTMCGKTVGIEEKKLKCRVVVLSSFQNFVLLMFYLLLTSSLLLNPTEDIWVVLNRPL